MCLRKHWTSVALCFCAVLTVGICLGDEPAAPTVAASWVDSSDRAPGTRQTFEIDGDEYGLRWIPAGEFEMGDPQDPNGRKNDRPQRHATRPPILAHETTVTQKLYRQIMGAELSTGRRPARRYISGTRRPTLPEAQNGSRRTCRRTSTEAQWNMRAAPERRPLNWGDKWDKDKAVLLAHRREAVSAQSVGSLRYAETSGICVARLRPLPRGSLVDHQGPQEFERRVVRGGGWVRRA